MKKLISALLSLCFIFNVFVFSASAFEEKPVTEFVGEFCIDDYVFQDEFFTSTPSYYYSNIKGKQVYTAYSVLNDLEKEYYNRIIGLDRLKAIHINDTKNPYESHKDRHEKIGEGYLGNAAFEKIINNERLKDLPFYLETPNELDGYEKEIAYLKSIRK